MIAALPELTKSAPVTEAKPLPGPSVTELTRVIQLELYRLGCGTSEANGKWNQSTREGLRKFNASMHAKLDINEPSHTTIVALQRQSDRACPMVCERGFVARGTTCVAVAKPEPSRKSRHVEQRSKRPARAQRQEAAPAAQQQQQQQPVASSGPMIMGPPMGGFFFMGGFGRHH